MNKLAKHQQDHYIQMETGYDYILIVVIDNKNLYPEVSAAYLLPCENKIYYNNKANNAKEGELVTTLDFPSAILRFTPFLEVGVEIIIIIRGYTNSTHTDCMLTAFLYKRKTN